MLIFCMFLFVFFSQFIEFSPQSTYARKLQIPYVYCNFIHILMYSPSGWVRNFDWFFSQKSCSHDYFFRTYHVIRLSIYKNSLIISVSAKFQQNCLLFKYFVLRDQFDKMWKLNGKKVLLCFLASCYMSMFGSLYQWIRNVMVFVIL